MSRISEQQIVTLSRIPLEQVLIALGAQRDSADRSKWRTAAGNVHVGRSNEKQLYNSFDGSGLKGGGPIDLVQQVRSSSFREAVDWLAQTFPHARTPALQDSLLVYDQTKPLEPATYVPAACEVTWPIVRAYLVVRRRLDPDLVDSLHEASKILSDRRGNAVFIHEGSAGCEIRGCTERKFALSYGRKTGFVIAGLPGKETWLLESAIDAISVKQLRPDATVISLGGNNAKLETHCLAGIRGPMVIGYDSDDAGERMAKRARLVRPAAIRVAPVEAKDWNDALHNPERQVATFSSLDRRLQRFACREQPIGQARLFGERLGPGSLFRSSF
jgi:Toprim-like/Protein of unknown function (DUF3991)